MSERDPFDLLEVENNIINETRKMRKKIGRLSRKNVTADRLDEFARAGGDLSDTTFGNSRFNEDGMKISGGEIFPEQWIALGLPSDEASNYVYAIAVDETNNRIYVGGGFTKIGGVKATNIAYWDKATRQFYSIGGSLNGDVYALAVYNGTLIVGGGFTNANGIATADYIASYNGSWAALGGGGGTLNADVRALKVSGTDLYIGGNFTNAAGLATADYIVKYSLSGSSWASIGGQLNSTVYAIEVYEGVVYVGGLFTNADGISAADYIAKYSGSAWSALGSSGGLISNVGAAVFCLLAYNGVLYIGGAFTDLDGDSTMDYIGCFDILNQVYFSIGGTITASVARGVWSLALNGDGYLHVGGDFSTINSVTNGYGVYDVNNAVWLENVAELSSGGDVLSLVYDEAGNLYMGGTFDTINGIETLMIAAQFYALDDVLETFNANIVQLQDKSGKATAFTPVVKGSSTDGTASYTQQTGAAIPLNHNLVFFTLRVVYTGHTGTGDLQIHGLPHIASTVAGVSFPLTVQWSNLTLPSTAHKVFAYVVQGDDYIAFEKIDSGATSALAMDAAATIIVSGFYMKDE